MFNLRGKIFHPMFPGKIFGNHGILLVQYMLLIGQKGMEFFSIILLFLVGQNGTIFTRTCKDYR